MELNEKILQSVGKRIRDLRLERQLSQEKLAELAGFDRTYISLVERGKRNLSLINLFRFSKALGVSVSDLVGSL